MRRRLAEMDVIGETEVGSVNELVQLVCGLLRDELPSLTVEPAA